jgi:hypothetical protein
MFALAYVGCDFCGHNYTPSVSLIKGGGNVSKNVSKGLAEVLVHFFILLLQTNNLVGKYLHFHTYVVSAAKESFTYRCCTPFGIFVPKNVSKGLAEVLVHFFTGYTQLTVSGEKYFDHFLKKKKVYSFAHGSIMLATS